MVPPLDHIYARSEDCLGDEQASAPLSSAHRSHTCQARNGSPISTQTQKTSEDSDDQTLGTEYAVVNREVNTEHVDPCTTQSTGVLGHELALTIQEPITGLKFTSPILVQRQLPELSICES